MPFTKERAERLTALLELIEGKEMNQRKALTYLAVPYLKETDEIVTAQLASEEAWDETTLLDSAAIMRYLAEAYERLGRFAVAAQYYERAITLASTLYTEYGKEVQDGSGMLYRALKAKNFYTDDDCEALRDLALTFMDKKKVGEIFDTALQRRRSLKHDPVEMTEEYLAVIDEVEEKIEKTREHHGFGSCYHVWQLKTEYLAEKGITWRSPHVLNPRVRFD